MQKIFKNKKIFLFLLLNVFAFNTLKAQLSLELYYESFNNPFPTVFTNQPGAGINVGLNQWVVNNVYTGTPFYPNVISQDSTYSGTISGAPFSTYLHIVNTTSPATNDNYDAASQSDRFSYTTQDICTYGFDSVYFSFFYLSEGSPTAYGEVYYSINNGTWTQIGSPQYNSTPKWKFENITDPVFTNRSSIRFGFRWVNDAGTTSTPTAMAVDDIRCIAFYNPNAPAASITSDSIAPNPVCQGGTIIAKFAVSDTLCDGNYNIQMSDATGSFATPTYLGAYSLGYPGPNYYLALPIAGTTPVGNCYKIRMNRIAPPPVIVGQASLCFSVIDCPEHIYTHQPAVTLDSNAVCVGSVIDVPFNSDGVFTNNLYSAQLSDANGIFPSGPPFHILGTLPSDQSFPGPPGSVSGKIPNMPDGCNYWIRVVGSNPSTIGTPWGPFCIQHCDIETNGGHDLHVCLQPTTQGWDTLVTVNIHHWDSVQTYLPGNKFSIELRNMGPPPWAFVNIDSLGWVIAVDDTTIHLVVPPLLQLIAMGISPGAYYMRIVASNTTFSDSAIGSVVRLTIGAPSDIPPTVTTYSVPDFVMTDTICTGGTMDFLLNFPHPNQSSDYIWRSPQLASPGYVIVPGMQGGGLGISFGGFTGVFTVYVRESNNGCLATDSTPVSVVIQGPPNTTITGPLFACVGDTVHLTAPNSGLWDNFHKGSIIQEGNDELFIRFDSSSTTAGNQISFNAQNTCGSAVGTFRVKVLKPPAVSASPSETSVCYGTSVQVTTLPNISTSGVYSYYWFERGDTVAKTQSPTVNADSSTQLIVVVRTHGVCPTPDTVNINVNYVTEESYSGKICPNGTDTLTLSGIYAAGSTFSWSNGQSSQNIIISDTGTYIAHVMTDTSVCERKIIYSIGPTSCRVLAEDTVNLKLPNVFTPDGDGSNDYFTPMISGPFDRLEVTIYNRWGKIVYGPLSDPFFKWDGKDNHGHKSDAGVYYWIVNSSWKENHYPTQRGFVTLIRGNN